MASATLSLPVPVSPVMSTEASVRAMSGIRSNTACILALWPMMVSTAAGSWTAPAARVGGSSRVMTRPATSSPGPCRGARVNCMARRLRSRPRMSPSTTRGSPLSSTSRKMRPRPPMLERRTKSTYRPRASSWPSPVRASSRRFIATTRNSRSTTTMGWGMASSRSGTAMSAGTGRWASAMADAATDEGTRRSPAPGADHRGRGRLAGGVRRPGARTPPCPSSARQRPRTARAPPSAGCSPGCRT